MQIYFFVEYASEYIQSGRENDIPNTYKKCKKRNA